MEENQKDNLKPALINSSALDGLLGMGASVLDVIVAPVVKSLTSMAESVPVLGAAVSAGKAFHAIGHQLFVRKLTLFLLELDKTPVDECEDFLEEMNTDSKYRQEVGEELLLILDRLDSVQKAPLISRILSVFMRKKIDYEDYKRFSALVDRAHLPDLLSLMKFDGGHSISEPIFTRKEIQGLTLIGITGSSVMRINEAADGKPGIPTHYLSAGLTEVGIGFHGLLREL